ncbi:MAG: hypothetical protein FRX48_06828 [Lasallia pustulata]|uniref:Uncharacterized protein n=1 Tax=Lasallia pustulata TaxID=136370 RepID=A0A5M8PK11_9LECA|nr:MAG: hypothetical protein FRX48_06828 [Lasallia pustulata]
MASLARLLGFSSHQTKDQASPISSPPLKQPLKQRLDRRSMSPTTRTKEWVIHTPDPSSGSETPSILRVKGSKVVKRKQITPSSTRRSGASPKRRGGSYWGLSWLIGKNQDANSEKDEADAPIEDDMLDEGDTLIEVHMPATPTSTSQHVNGTGNDTTLIPGDSDEDDYVGELTKEEKEEHLLDVDAGRIQRQEMIKQIERGDRTPEEIALLKKLTMCGFEPLLPRNWMMDFKTLPETMFTNDESRIFINAASGNEFRATRAICTLISLGVHGRDRLICSLAPEDTLRRGIESYIKWSERDGHISRTSDSHIPVLTVCTAKPGESVASVVARVTEQLHNLGRRYRQKWLLHPSIEGSEADKSRSPHSGKANVTAIAAGEALDDEESLMQVLTPNGHEKVAPEDEIGRQFSHDLPTLFGIVIKHNVVAIVSYDVAVPGQEVRSIATYNLAQPGQDVWNGLAIAILVVSCRNYLMDLAAEEEAERQNGVVAEGEEEDA